jgi:glycosyltransferase involved in cell wall biosynthesis
MDPSRPESDIARPRRPGTKQGLRILAADSDLLAAAGRQRGFVDLVRGLSERGHSIDVFYRDSGPLKDALPESCRTVQVPGFLELLLKGGAEQIRFARSVFAGMRGRYDLVLVNQPLLCAFAVAIGRLKRIPSFCRLRDHRFGYSKRSRLLLGQVDHLVAVSNFIRDHYVHNIGMDATRVHVSLCSVDTSYYRPASTEARAKARRELGLPPDAFVILYAGRIDHTKGVDVLIDAFNTLASRDGEPHLVIAGGPGIEDHSAMPTAAGLAYQRQMMESSPSSRCTWGRSQAGRPTPLSGGGRRGRAVEVGRTLRQGRAGTDVGGDPGARLDRGGIPKVLTGRFREFLVAADDPAALADALARIQGWREREPELGAACRDHVVRNFTLDREIDKLERLFFTAVGRRRSS